MRLNGIFLKVMIERSLVIYFPRGLSHLIIHLVQCRLIMPRVIPLGQLANENLLFKLSLPLTALNWESEMSRGNDK